MFRAFPFKQTRDTGKAVLNNSMGGGCYELLRVAIIASMGGCLNLKVPSLRPMYV